MGFHGDSEIEDYEAIKTKVMGAMKQLFNPEFINRIDETIVFKSLERSDIENIVDIMMERVNLRVADKNIRLKLTPQAKDFMVEKGYDSEYGARPMRRTIQKYIEDPLSQLIIEGTVPEGEVAVDLDTEKQQLVFQAQAKLVESAETT